jgi:hypothetical protein
MMNLMVRYFHLSLSVNVVFWRRWSRSRKTLELIDPLCYSLLIIGKISTGREGKEFASTIVI